jgi:diguanylate cyclase (GGDEF)-like protein
MSAGRSSPLDAAPVRLRWLDAGALGLGAALLAVFVLRALTGAGGPSAQRLCATWISDAIALSAAAVCARRALLDRNERVVWSFAALAILSWGLGDAYFEHSLAAGVELPNPSPADIGFIAFYPLVYVAAIAARRRDGAPLRAGLWLDGAIGMAACATLACALVLEPVVKATAGESLAGALTNVAYPLGDLTLFAMLVFTTATVGWRAARGLLLLALGMAAFSISDTLYLVENANGTYQGGGVLDSGWLIALMLIAAGAAMPGVRAHPRAARAAAERALVPSAAGLVALTVLALQPVTSIDGAGIACAGVTLALVLTRMALSQRETAQLLVAREREAARDPLTGLANRRVLLEDLRRAARAASKERPALLVLFDLDGFKAYNDTFGHSAGDGLLIRVAAALREAVGERGRAYRIGGDEFCALLGACASPASVGDELAAAMAQHGEGFSVTASFGCAVAPVDGAGTTALLRRADDEMYARKGRRRPGTESQVQDVLIAALAARDPGMESHADGVTMLAAAVGEMLDLEPSELRALSHAAALHDVGKIAIPDELLDKQSELDEEERRFVQTHPLIAQRIISAAPALGYAAQIVRSVQERFDGGGYPDGLAGEAIPLAARIVGACNAYQAMITRRAGREPLSPQQAVAELRRCAGSQFDPRVVDTLIEVLAHPSEHPAPALPTPTQTADLLASRESAGRRRLEAQLSYQSDHDLLTGLLNRRRFAEELERVLRYASRYRRSGALVILDIDHLKLVNDLHGHVAGDEAIKAVGREIAARARNTDLTARLGADEFALALHEAGEPEARLVIEQIAALVARRGIDPQPTISAGVALFAGDQELTADDLLTAADVALYEAKEAGGRQTRVYRGDSGAALGWVQRIRSALQEQRFVLHAQPIVSLRDGSVEHRELLVRMLSDDGDAIPPSAFIPTAERFGLITEIDRWVTAQGLAMAVRGEGVSVNLSAHSMGDGEILELVREAARAGLARGLVIFEITETAAMTNMHEARRFAEALGGLGCDVALDDFGTGFGSFSYLKHLPSRYLKIDVEFVRDLASSETDRQVVKAIAEVGHSLGKLIIAEGVEDRAALQILREHGIDYAQGRYLGAPAPLAAAGKSAGVGAGAGGRAGESANIRSCAGPTSVSKPTKSDDSPATATRR